MVTLAGGVLIIKKSNTRRYVLRGWLELPEMTIMKLNGPWYEDPISRISSPTPNRAGTSTRTEFARSERPLARG
jgi:hypothetical protein